MPPTVRVTRLTLRGPCRGRGRSAALVEEALRVASYPGLPCGAMIAVRRLDLGPIGPGTTSQALAARLDQQLRDLPGSAVRISAASATDTLVYAHDRIEVLAALALSLARGDPPAAWFWPDLVPGFTARAGVVAGLRLCLHLAAAGSPSPLLGQAQLLAAAPAAQAALLAVAEDLLPDLPDATPPIAPPPASIAPWFQGDDPPHPFLRAIPTDWPGTDPRRIRVAALAIIDRLPSTAQHPALAAWAAALADRSVAATPSSGSIATAQPRAEQAPGGTILPASVATSPERGPGLGDGTPAPGPAARTIGSGSGTTPVAEDEGGTTPPGRDWEPEPSPVVSGSGTYQDTKSGGASGNQDPRPAIGQAGSTLPRSMEPWPWQGAASAWAGAWFVIPLLDRLDLAAVMAQQPELTGLGLIAALVRRYRACPQDPLFACCDPPQPWETLPTAFIAPESWRAWVRDPRRRQGAITDRRNRVLLAIANDQPLPAWLAKPRAATASRPPPDLAASIAVLLRRCLQRYAHDQPLGLRQVLRRPGCIQATRTHIDVRFPLADADVRIRLRGLDLDPGWVPWLGRVVTYRYEAAP